MRRGGTAAALALVLVASSVAASSQTAHPGVDAAWDLVRTLAGSPGAPASVSAPSEDLDDALGRFYAVAVGVRLDPAELADADRALGALGAHRRRALRAMLDAMSDATLLRAQAFAGVDGADVHHAERVARALAGGSSPPDPAAVARAAAVVGRIDVRRMLDAAALVRAAARDTLHAFREGPAIGARIETPFDAITIGSSGDDRYERDVQLLIDPAGDDTYLNNAGGVRSSQAFDATGGCVAGGGATGKAGPNLACTPLPSRICTYDTLNRAAETEELPVLGVPAHDAPGSGDGRDGSCGNDERRRAMIEHTAAIGDDGDSRVVAAVLDASGSDTYTAEWSHHDPLFGLIAACFPDDASKTNTNRDHFQGGALAGIGLLWDDGPGDNTFRARLSSQGSGHVGGVGMLLSTGGGDDLYWADRLSQASGTAGGVGILVDTGGEDTYLLEPPVVYRTEFAPSGKGCNQEGRSGQGHGGFGGVGVLWSEGRATYRAVVHVVEPAFPYAPVRDAAGAPLLVPGPNAQGSGDSFPLSFTPGGLAAGAGVLVQRGGEDGVCPGSGKRTGADHSVRSPGEVDRSCGVFNVDPEISAADLQRALTHLAGGAVGVRVVLP